MIQCIYIVYGAPSTITSNRTWVSQLTKCIQFRCMSMLGGTWSTQEKIPSIDQAAVLQPIQSEGKCYYYPSICTLCSRLGQMMRSVWKYTCVWPLPVATSQFAWKMAFLIGWGVAGLVAALESLLSWNFKTFMQKQSLFWNNYWQKTRLFTGFFQILLKAILSRVFATICVLRKPCYGNAE